MHPRGHGHARPPCQHGRTMDFNASLSRFYALPVTAAIAAAVDTDFADTQTSEVCSTACSCFSVYRQHNGNLKLVGLELHEKCIVGGSAVGT